MILNAKGQADRSVWVVRCVSYCIAAAVLTACATEHQDHVREFTAAIKRELAGDSGRLCAIVDEFPYPDSPFPAENQAELHAMARAGIVESFNGPAPGSFKYWRLTNEHDPLFVRYGPPSPQNRHGCYQYGRLQLVRIEGWRELTTANNDKATIVSFTYQIDNLASWAKDPELRQVAEDSTSPGGIWPVVAGQNKALSSIDLVATPDGWKKRPFVYAPEIVTPPPAAR
ncbi:hypothetical protein [Burkholderia guangdongensis]|uniref:hypothetical protein n=1 Tax=Burkholderia guangdongensis TaxID=1792500 RepID=UPI0015CABB04|nr:hypothetical protein [Burkholderia guangdongensis]